MGLVESREKNGGIAKMLRTVIRQCRKAIEENIQHGKAISALECFPFKSLRILAEKIPFISAVNTKDGPCSLLRSKLPVYTAETHRKWMFATFITLQNVIKDLLSMYRNKPSSTEADLSKLEEVLLRAHGLVHLAPSSHLLEKFDKTQNITFKIRPYLLKISSRIRAIHTLCVSPYAGYHFNYHRMGVGFIPPQRQDSINLRWDDMKSAISRLKYLQSTIADLPPNREILAFSKEEERRLEDLWNSTKVKRGLRNIPLHAEMQLVQAILETPGCRPRSGYIAVSKRCCFLCTLFLELWNECIGYYSQLENKTPKEEQLPVLAIAGTHGKCYYRWMFPRVEVADTPLGKRIRRSLAYVAYGMVATVMFTPERTPKIGRPSEAHLRQYLPSDSNVIRGMKHITFTMYDGTESLQRFENEYGHLFSILDSLTRGPWFSVGIITWVRILMIGF